MAKKPPSTPKPHQTNPAPKNVKVKDRVTVGLIQLHNADGSLMALAAYDAPLRLRDRVLYTALGVFEQVDEQDGQWVYRFTAELENRTPDRFITLTETHKDVTTRPVSPAPARRFLAGAVKKGKKG